MLLDSTSCGIDVQTATQCQWLYGTGSLFSSTAPWVGTAKTLGDSSSSEAVIAAKRVMDNMVKNGDHWSR